MFGLSIWRSVACVGLLVFVSGCELASDTTWMKVPIDACVQSNAALVPDQEAVRLFCECLIPEVYALVKKDRQKVRLLKTGDLDFIKHTNDPLFIEKSKQCQPADIQLADQTPVRFDLTPNMERGIKIGLRDDMIKKGMVEKINIDAYCDCVLEGLKSDFTRNEFRARALSQNPKYQALEQTCQTKHQKSK